MAPAYYGTGGGLYTVAANTTAATQWATTNFTVGSAGTSIIYSNYDDGSLYGGEYLSKQDGKLVIPKGKDLLLPDGSVLHVDDLGNYTLDDANAKVVYQANRMREFNPYVNASDLLASFIRYLGALGLNRADAGLIPVVLFINWLVIEAANQDGDPIPADIVPPELHPLFRQRIAALIA